MSRLEEVVRSAQQGTCCRAGACVHRHKCLWTQAEPSGYSRYLRAKCRVVVLDGGKWLVRALLVQLAKFEYGLCI